MTQNSADTKKEKNNRKDTDSFSTLRKKQNRRKKLFGFFREPATVALITAVGLVALFPVVITRQQFDLPDVGDVADETIIAPFTYDIYKSEEELENQREEAREKVPLVLDYHNKVNEKINRRFYSLRKGLQKLERMDVPSAQKESILDKLKEDLSERTIETLKTRRYFLEDAVLRAREYLEQGILATLICDSREEVEKLEHKYNSTIDDYLIYKKNYVLLRKDTVEQTVAAEHFTIKSIVVERIINSLQQSVYEEQDMFREHKLNSLYDVLYNYLEPNVTVNEKQTALRRERAAMSVKSTEGKVIKNTVIVRKNQIVTPQVQEKLKSLYRVLNAKRTQESDTWKRIAAYGGGVLLSLFALGLLAYYVKTFHPFVIRSSHFLWALACIILLQVALIRFFMLIGPTLFKQASFSSPLIMEFIIPTAIAAILTSILFDLRLSMIVTLFVALFFGLMLGYKFMFFVYALFGGLVAAYTHRNIRYRRDFFKAIPPLIGAYALIIFLYHLINFNVSLSGIMQNIALGCISAATASFFTMMCVPVFENVFNMTSNMTLVELSDMNHPLLKQLSIRAAGTYNHSVLVANLAESAAEKIGANSLFARVASYYHDVGKMEKPNYFIENIVGAKNIHNKLSPSMSALILSSHVKDGMEMAKKHRLPRVIIDAIQQHHGTGMISFFYEKAKEQDPHDQINEKDFRYPGPLPQTKENALIMLADSVEAASRSLKKSSPKLLRDFVKKIIRDKFLSYQLDECDLTLRDLEKVVEGFMPVLQGIFHTRIEYNTTTQKITR